MVLQADTRTGETMTSHFAAFESATSTYTANPTNLLPNAGDEQSTCDVYYNISTEYVGDITYTQGDTLYLTIFLPLVLLVGVLDNAAFIYVVLRIQRMRTVTNCYLVGLSLADIIFLMFAIGSKIWSYVNSPLFGDDNPLGLSGCQVVLFMMNTSYFVSLCFITLVSWERYNGVCRPHRRRDTKARVFANVVVSTALSATLAGSLLVSFGVESVECFTWPTDPQYDDWPNVRMQCTSVFRWAEKFSYAAQTVPFFLSLVVNVFLYYKIIKGLDQSIRRTQQSNHRKSRESSTRNQVAKMLIINGIVLFALLAPFEFASLFSLIALIRDRYIIPHHARMIVAHVARVASYFNSLINPIIYTVLSSRYREAFQVAFLPAKCRPRQRGSENSHPGSTGRSGTMTTRAHESRM